MKFNEPFVLSDSVEIYDANQEHGYAMNFVYFGGAGWTIGSNGRDTELWYGFSNSGSVSVYIYPTRIDDVLIIKKTKPGAILMRVDIIPWKEWP